MGIADFSNTQYALLGLHEAIESGVVKVDARTYVFSHGLERLEEPPAP